MFSSGLLIKAKTSLSNLIGMGSSIQVDNLKEVNFGSWWGLCGAIVAFHSCFQLHSLMALYMLAHTHTNTINQLLSLGLFSFFAGYLSTALLSQSREYGTTVAFD